MRKLPLLYPGGKAILHTSNWDLVPCWRNTEHLSKVALTSLHSPPSDPPAVGCRSQSSSFLHTFIILWLNWIETLLLCLVFALFWSPHGHLKLAREWFLLFKKKYKLKFNPWCGPYSNLIAVLILRWAWKPTCQPRTETSENNLILEF